MLFLQLAVFCVEVHARSNSVYIYTAFAAFIGSATIPYLSFLNHGRSVAPFDLLSMILASSICLDLIQAIALYFVKEYHCEASILNVSSIAGKALLLILESQSKRHILREEWQNWSLEETESAFSIAFYWWVNSLLRKGRSKLLELDSLSSIPRALSSTTLRERMRTCWESRCE